MAQATYWEALRQARTEHRISIEDEPWPSLGAYWACSCGARAGRRMIPPTGPMADAAAVRHVDAVARRIVKASRVTEDTT